ncbi:MAG: YlxR family protein [Gloeomargaritaceae cyanobacterium C42_A2020_066]|nr:YlxR family protein [Gloeomargaritaceae cyanobacterium C42_A2020_066]
MRPGYRRCLSCRRLAPRQEFWRVVRLQGTHQVQLDEGQGRSAYLCPTADCLKQAQQKNRLGRALKAPVSPEIYAQLWSRLSQ